MTDFVPASDENDEWLTDQYSALLGSVASTLDLDAGMQDVLVRARHADLVAGLGDILDLEAGLRAAVHAASDTPTTPEGLEQHLLPSLQVLITAIGASALRVRLTIRTHPAIRALDSARQLITDLANTRDSGLAKGLLHLRLFRDCLERIDQYRGAQTLPPALSRALDRVRLRDDRTVARVVILEIVRTLDAISAREQDTGVRADLALARGSAIELGRVLVRYLAGNVRLGLLDALQQAQTVDARERDLRFGEVLTDTLDRHLYRNRAHAAAASREIAGELDNALTLVGSLPRDIALALTRFVTDAMDVDDTLGVALTLVHDTVNDFSGLDLRTLDLTGVSLSGVRWSAKTQWPAGRRAEIQRNSVLIGPGLFEIRDGLRWTIKV
jgi:hypothetical protein